MKVKSTIVILTKSTQADHTKKCLYFIEKNTRDYELFLVRDDPRAFGFSKNNNRIMRIALGDYFVLVNDDCFVTDSQWLEKMIVRAESDEKIGIVAPILKSPEGEVQYLIPKNIDSQGLVSVVAFACVLLKKSMVDHIGLLDEGFRFGSEDNEYCQRALSHGWKIAIASDVSLIHLANTSRDMRSLTEYMRGTLRIERMAAGDSFPTSKAILSQLILVTDLPRRFTKYKAEPVFFKLRALRNRFFRRITLDQ
jgi:GT2 family glycosyltransferase